MRFVFPAVFAVFIALLFYEVYSLSHSLSEFDLPNPSRPNPLQSSRLHRHLRPT